MSITQLAKDTFYNALESVKPSELVKASVRVIAKEKKLQLRTNGDVNTYDLSQHNNILIVGAGKASQEMCRGLVDVFVNSNIFAFVDLQIRAFVNIPKGQKIMDRPSEWPTSVLTEFLEASHPIPDESTIRSTNKQLYHIYHSKPGTLLICLISGGGSALFETTNTTFEDPDGAIGHSTSDVTLADLQELNKLLIASGASINEINIVRKHVSQVKGGRLALHAMKSGNVANTIGLYLSDVVGNDIASVASGPTAPDPSTFNDAVQIVKNYKLWDSLPASVKQCLSDGLAGKQQETPKLSNTEVFERVCNVLIGSADTSAEAAKQFLLKHGWYHINVFSNSLAGEAREFGASLIDLIAKLTSDRNKSSEHYKAALIGTGEFTVTIRGKGVGGRNQEMLLSFLITLVEQQHRDNFPLADLNFAVVSCAFDGIEGNSPATGAIVDSTSVSRLEKLLGKSGVELADELKRELDNNNSHHVFKLLNDAFITGHTGTNVNDMLLILVESKRS